MSNWWKYALAGVGGAFFAGTAGTTLGYYFGYYKSEPEILILDRERHGFEGWCVVKSANEMVCAADANYDGAVDVVLMDVEKQEIKEVVYGKDDCVSKRLRTLEQKLQKQQEQEPSEPKQ